MEVQLMINATPYWCFESSPQYQILYPSSVVVSPKSVQLTSTKPRMSHRKRFTSPVSSCTFQAYFAGIQCLIYLGSLLPLVAEGIPLNFLGCLFIGISRLPKKSVNYCV